MKKIIAILMAVVMLLTLAACSEKANDSTDPATEPTAEPTTEPQKPAFEGSMSDLINAMYEKYEIDMMLLDNTSVDPADELLPFYVGVSDGSKISEAYYSEAAININPYLLSAVRVADPKDAKAVAEDVLNTCDPGRWVCVRPDAVRVGMYGDMVVMVMGSTDDVDGIMNAFSQVVGADLELVLQK